MLFNKRVTSASLASTETLASTTSTVTSSSTAALTGQKSQPRAEKDYFATLGALQTSYGFGGGAPTPTFSPAPKHSKSKKVSTPKQTSVAPAQGKDWEAAYGAMSASYGFGGSAPVLPGQASWLQSKK